MLGVALVLAVGAASCNAGPVAAGSEKPTGEGQGSSAGETTIEAVPVATWSVTSRSFRETFTVPGSTRAARTVAVSAEAPGRVLSAPFDEGDTLEEGDVLVRVEADVDRARLKRLENQVETAKREYERLQNLNEEGVATNQQLDNASSRLEDARLQLEEARVGLRKTTTRSPVSGRVTSQFVEEGEYAAPGAPVAEVVDWSTLEATTEVPESKLRAIDSDAEVTVRFPAVGETVEASVSQLPLEVSSATRTYPVELRMPNDDRQFRPGMRLSATFDEKTWSDVVLVPRSAILYGYAATEVAVAVDGDDGRPRVEVREVSLGPGDGARIVVTDGLDPGDRLLVRGHRSVTDEMPVDIVREFESLDAVLEGATR